MSPTGNAVPNFPGRRRLHPFYVLIAFGSLFCLVVMGATASMIWRQRATAIEAAGINLQNLSRAVADQTDRVIQSVEVAESRLLDQMTLERDNAAGEAIGMTGSKQLNDLMRDIITGMSEAYSLVLIDADGKLVNFTYAFPVPTRSLADRQYFQFARAHPELRTFVSETVMNRQSNEPNFYVVHRLTGRDGAFRGILMGAIRVDYIERLFSASTLPPGGSVMLFRPDGTMLVRHPAVPREAMLGREAEFRNSFFRADHGAIRRMGVFDGTERLTAVSDLPRHDLRVAVSVPFSTVMSAWSEQAIWTGGIAALGCLSIIVTVILAIHRFRDQQRLEAAVAGSKLDDERRRADQEVAEQHAKFDLALDNMNQGILMFDQANRLTLVNRAAREIFHLGPGQLVYGADVATVVTAVSGSAGLTAPADTVAAYYMQLVEEAVPRKLVRTLSDGRQLATNFIPYGQGWLLSFEDMTETRKADERIAHMALHDALTGLPNRVMLRLRTEEALAGVEESGSLAMVCVDLDNFKTVNDTLGHPAGDKLLCLVANRIRTVARHSDMVARLGGDEFAVLSSPIENVDAIEALAKRLVSTVSEPYEIDGQRVVIGASLGISLAPHDGTDPDTLMKHADLALYRAKNDGRGRHAFFAASMLREAVERRRIETELLSALENQEFEVYYQPLVSVPTRRICGFEALLRWNHPARGMVSPLDFIPVAEENGSIVPIGEWVLNRACQDAMQWPSALKVAVNLSPAQFRSGNLVGVVATAHNASGLSPSRLELEITEGTMMQDTEATVSSLWELRTMGVRVAMDDFGTGYSSLAYLQKFPFDKIKIDRAFVRDLDRDANRAIIRAVNGIADTMGITTLAEGVETEEQYQRLVNKRCDEVQGYLFGKPTPIRGAMALLAAEARDRAGQEAELLTR
jgi:diguanylate cyclase (GGDEF)-like protein